MVWLREKLTSVIGIVTLALSLMVGYANLQSDITRLEERVASQNESNTRTIEVINKLAVSVDKLSHSVTRLDERMKVVERQY